MINAETHKKFQQALLLSDEGVQRIAGHLRSLGYTARTPELRVAPTHEVRGQYGDGGDIHIEGRVEVKTLSIDFTCSEDWPYGRHFIVNSVGSHERASPKPVAYYIQNKAMTHFGIVWGASRGSWYTERRRNPVTGDMQDFYFCPKELVRFGRVRDEL